MSTGVTDIDVDLPIDVFTRLIFMIAEEHGEISVEQAMESGLLQRYINDYKAGNIELPTDEDFARLFEDEE